MSGNIFIFSGTRTWTSLGTIILLTIPVGIQRQKSLLRDWMDEGGIMGTLEDCRALRHTIWIIGVQCLGDSGVKDCRLSSQTQMRNSTSLLTSCMTLNFSLSLWVLVFLPIKWRYSTYFIILLRLNEIIYYIYIIYEKRKWKSLTLIWTCDPMDCSLPDSSVHEVLQARILEWVAIPFSRGSSQPRDQTQGLPRCRWILYQLSHQESPRILQWVAYPFSRESFQPRDRSRVSCIEGRFFTSWATSEI